MTYEAFDRDELQRIADRVFMAWDAPLPKGVLPVTEWGWQ